MKKSVFLMITFMAAGMSAQAQETAVTTWQGTYKQGDDLHRVVLQASHKDGGPWSVEGLYVDLLSSPVHVDSSSVTNSQVKLSANAEKGHLDGRLSPDGSEFAGTWSWENHPVSLVLHRISNEAAWHVPLLYQYHLNEVTYSRPAPEEPKIPFSPRLAVDYMEQGALAWTKEWQCVACHTNGTYMVVRPMMATELGAPQQQMRDYFVSVLHKAQQGKANASEPEVDPTQMVYIAAGLAIWDAHITHRLSPETSQALELMFKSQRPSGDWFIGDDNNPPLESSTYQLATVAARAVANAPGWLAQQRGTPLQAHVDLLKQYLREPHKMQGDYDKTDLLWTASEYPGLLDARQKQDLIKMVLDHQQFDGGWSIRGFAAPEEWGKGNRADKLRSELEYLLPQSDGHMTGLAIIALRKAGVPASDPHIQRGVQWLLNNQRSSGRWWTRSLNRDGWQFITYSGTAYPLLALSLCNALPERLPVQSVNHGTAGELSR